MRSLFRMVILLPVLCWLAVSPASAAEKLKRIAVMPFQNVGGEKLDIGAGIADTLTTDLGQIRTFAVVERSLLNDVLKEIKLSTSGAVDPATAQKAGKLLAADSIVVGSFQKSDKALRINARLIDVENGTVRETVKVDGLYTDLFKMQDDVTALLAEKLKGGVITDVERKQIAALPAKNLDAFNVFSAGLVDLRKESLQDAIEKFDKALPIHPNYT